MSNVKQLEITYNDKTEVIHYRRLRFSEMMKLNGFLSGDAPESEKVGMFYPQFISATVCDADGNKLYSADEVDSWTEEKDGVNRIIAYGTALNKVMNPGN